MPRYTIGAQPTKDAAGNPGAPQMVIIEADTYVIDNSFVTFLKDRRPIISVPFLKIGIVAELDQNNQTPLKTANITQQPFI